MNDTFKVICIIAAVIAFIVFAAWGSLQLYKWIAPQRAAAERKVFEETPSFVHGKIQHISRLRLEYSKAEPGAARESLRQLIIMEASNVNREKLPYELRTFVEQLRRAQ